MGKEHSRVSYAPFHDAQEHRHVLNDLFHPQSGSLIDTVKDISQRAAERGMTPEILDELLKDDE